MSSLGDGTSADSDTRAEHDGAASGPRAAQQFFGNDSAAEPSAKNKAQVAKLFADILRVIDYPRRSDGDAVKAHFDRAQVLLGNLPEQERVQLVTQVVQHMQKIRDPRHGDALEAFALLSELTNILVGGEGVTSDFHAPQKLAMSLLETSGSGAGSLLGEIRRDDEHRVRDRGDFSPASKDWRSFHLAKGCALFHVLHRIQAHVAEANAEVEQFLTDHRLHVASLESEFTGLSHALAAMRTPEFYDESAAEAMGQLVSNLTPAERARLLEKSIEYVGMGGSSFDPHSLHVLLDRVLEAPKQGADPMGAEELTQLAKSTFDAIEESRGEFGPLFSQVLEDEIFVWKGISYRKDGEVFRSQRREALLFLCRTLSEVLARQEEQQREPQHVERMESTDMPRYVARELRPAIGQFFRRFEEAQALSVGSRWEELRNSLQSCSEPERQCVVKSLLTEFLAPNPDAERELLTDTLIRIAKENFSDDVTKLIGDTLHFAFTCPDSKGHTLSHRSASDFYHLYRMEATEESLRWCRYRVKEAEQYFRIMDAAHTTMSEAGKECGHLAEMLSHDAFPHPCKSVLRPNAHHFLERAFQWNGEQDATAYELGEAIDAFDDSDYEVVLTQLVERAAHEPVLYDYEATRRAVDLVLDSEDLPSFAVNELFERSFLILEDLIDRCSREQARFEKLEREGAGDLDRWRIHVEARKRLLPVALHMASRAAVELGDERAVSRLIDLVFEDWESRELNVQRAVVEGLEPLAGILEGEELATVVNQAYAVLDDLEEGSVWAEARDRVPLELDSESEFDLRRNFDHAVSTLHPLLRSTFAAAHQAAFQEVLEIALDDEEGEAQRFLEALGLFGGRENNPFDTRRTDAFPHELVNSLLGFYSEIIEETEDEELRQYCVTELYRVCSAALESDVVLSTSLSEFQSALNCLYDAGQVAGSEDEILLGLEDLSRAVSSASDDLEIGLPKAFLVPAATHLARSIASLPGDVTDELSSALALSLYELPEEIWDEMIAALPGRIRHEVSSALTHIMGDFESDGGAYDFLLALDQGESTRELAADLLPEERRLAAECVLRGDFLSEDRPKALRALYPKLSEHGDSGLLATQEFDADVGVFLNRIEELNQDGLCAQEDLGNALYGLRFALRRSILDLPQAVIRRAAHEVLRIIEDEPTDPVLAMRALDTAVELLEYYATEETRQLIASICQLELVNMHPLVSHAGYQLLESIASQATPERELALEKIVSAVESLEPGSAGSSAAVAAFHRLSTKFRDEIEERFYRRITAALLSEPLI